VSANGCGGTRGSGGIVGHNEGTVEYCINAGSVYNAYRRAGGIVGYNYGSSAKIDHCFNVGSVASAESGCAGAIAATNGEGADTAGIITNCYYLAGSSEAAIGLDSGSVKATVKEFNANGITKDGGSNDTTLLTALNDTEVAFIKAAPEHTPSFSGREPFNGTHIT
jgi:hypothetical protein